MKFLKSSLVLAAAALCGTAQAIPYNGAFNTGSAFDGLLTGVTGFDVYSNGSAAFFCSSAGGCSNGSIANGTQLNPATTVPLSTGNIVTTIYQGVVNVVNPGINSPNMIYPGSGAATTGYQITVAAIFQELVTFSASGLAILQPLDGGKISLFYDNSAGALPGSFITTADLANGVGYTDGMLIASGAVSAAITLPNTFTSDGTNAQGFASVNGGLSFVQAGSVAPGPDTVGFIPAPGGFQSTTTLQYGPNTSGYQVSNFFDNANGFSTTTVNSLYTIRADANVDLVALAVPEPGTLALVGLALAGLGFSQRRRNNKA